MAVEQWLKGLTVDTEGKARLLARATRAKIRNTMSALYNYAIRWQFTDKNPISGPVKGSGVRGSAKRMYIPDILTVDEMQKLISAVCRRERVLLFLDMVTGLRRGELAGLKWQDIDFLNLQLNVNRSVVDQHVGRCKTEISQKPVPIDENTAADLLEWYQETPFRAASDWVFATNSNRAAAKRGK